MFSKSLFKNILGNFFVNGELNYQKRIYYYNFWTSQNAENIWFSKFIKHHGLLEKYKGRINFYSILGSLEQFQRHHKGLNVFYSGENLMSNRFSEYRVAYEKRFFDLSLGFEKDHTNYLRLPIWLLTLFDPEADYIAIKEKVQQLTRPCLDNRTGFCSIVASHDWNGVRGRIMDNLSAVNNITSGGTFRNNTNDLKIRFNNNKRDFISQYKFNICPENSDEPGYVTEKLFQAIEAGCIPIYWGAGNNPEPEIINNKAVIFWNDKAGKNELVEKVNDIWENESVYRDFFFQERLMPNASEIIWTYYTQLHNSLNKLLKNM